ncbi:MAG: helix-turn-helix domain-containing protein [Limnochordia bacterium]
MDCGKTGHLIASLRKEKQMTQRQLADLLGVSDKAVSKWERGLGCPDVSLLNQLSQVLGVNIDQILLGELNPNELDGGNMRRIKFYFCPNCQSVTTTTGAGEEFSCCGRKLDPLEPQVEDGAHHISLEEIDLEYFVTVDHEMTKEHYLTFAALVAYDRVLLVKLYPEQAPEFRLPLFRRGKLYLHCNRHGLLVKDI